MLSAYFVIAVVFIALIMLGEEYMLSCPFHRLTGLDCPLCGAQRMLNALLRGEWGVAFESNPLLMLSLPLLLLWCTRLAFPRFTQRHRGIMLSPLFTDRALIVYLVILLLWGVLRNLFNL